MTQYTLTLLDTTGIQEYIFGSNQLAQNIGASELVERATSEWLVNAFDRLGISHNITWSLEKGVQFTGAAIPSCQAEVIYAGGGNAVILFVDDNQAVQFIKSLTRSILGEARGLEIVSVRKPLQWGEDGKGDSIAAVLADLRKQAFAHKLNHPASMPMPGLAVTAACAYTGLPAVGYNTDPALVGDEIAARMTKLMEKQLISKEVADKLRAEPQGKERLHAILPQVRKNNFGFVYDFDEFGDTGESSYIAVVHTDGNNMSKRFDAIAKNFGDVSNNRKYIDALRALSLSVRERASQALNATVDYLIAGLKNSSRFQPRRRGDTVLLPIRPIVFGGDDVTFVCDGRLGLDLAATYLQQFSQGKMSDEKPVYARAGVAVVKTHFPFSRAYNLAEELAHNAKHAIRAYQQATGREDVSVLDWHFSTTGVIRDLENIRGQDYCARTGKSLLMRPIYLVDQPSIWRNWANFTNMVEGFMGGAWAGKHNKVKDLQDALRGGPAEVALFCRKYRIDPKEMPPIAGKPKMQESGWENDECGYFDAIEALDFYIDFRSLPVNSQEAKV
jgi:hypothetical protein